MRSFMGEANEHQERRRALHREVQQELMTMRYGRQQHTHRKELSPDASSKDAHPSS
jgi:hypothetical protein